MEGGMRWRRRWGRRWGAPLASSGNGWRAVANRTACRGCVSWRIGGGSWRFCGRIAVHRPSDRGGSGGGSWCIGDGSRRIWGRCGVERRVAVDPRRRSGRRMASDRGAGRVEIGGRVATTAPERVTGHWSAYVLSLGVGGQAKGGSGATAPAEGCRAVTLRPKMSVDNRRIRPDHAAHLAQWACATPNAKSTSRSRAGWRAFVEHGCRGWANATSKADDRKAT